VEGWRQREERGKGNGWKENEKNTQSFVGHVEVALELHKARRVVEGEAMNFAIGRL